LISIDRLNKFINQNTKDVAVIGGGFIGVEVAENLRLADYNVTLIEGTNQLLRPFDYDVVQIFNKEIVDHGVNLIVEDTVERFEIDTVVLSSGTKVHANTVIMAIGVSPETNLVKELGLKIGETGAIWTDENYRTNDPDIYAIGDAIEVYNALIHRETKLSLAGPALKQARSIADHINKKTPTNRGYIGSSVIKVFDYNGTVTGLNESLIKSINKKNKKISYDCSGQAFL
jgi:NADPH-dependent 2,4-dienoyl-CoA reductase/sulfur reductase-like enzyme